MQAKRFLNNYFSCHSKIDILRTIISSEQPLSGRQIAAQAELSPRSCQLSLDELVKIKAINRRQEGKAYYYSVNLENSIITNLIIPIIQQEGRLTEQVVASLRDMFASVDGKAVGIYYLESWPRRWANKGIGALLLCIVPSTSVDAMLDRQLAGSVDRLLDGYGLPVAVVTQSSEQFAVSIREQPGLLERIGFKLQDIAGERFVDLVKREKGRPEHLRRSVDFFTESQN